MKTMFVLFFALVLTGAAKADLFSYSFYFGQTPDVGATVTGTFEGTLTGNGATGISNFTVSFDGAALPGSAALTTFDRQGHPSPVSPLLTSYTYTEISPVLYFDGSLNCFGLSNFDFTGAIPQSGDWWYFSLGYGNANAWAQMAQPLISDLGIDMAGFWPGYDVDVQHWSMTDLSLQNSIGIESLPVSEPRKNVPDSGSTAGVLAIGFSAIFVSVRLKNKSRFDGYERSKQSEMKK